MSVELQPIHYWVLYKIQLQETLIEELLRWSNEKGGHSTELQAESYRLYGKPIDENFHRSLENTNVDRCLQEKLRSAQYRLAYIFTKLLEEKYITLDETKDIFRENGIITARKIGIYEKGIIDAREVYKRLYDCLPEGRPSDEINEVIISTPEEVVWKTKECIQETYWNQVGGDSIYFYVLRQVWIEGFLQEGSMYCEELKKSVYTIRKK